MGHKFHYRPTPVDRLRGFNYPAYGIAGVGAPAPAAAVDLRSYCLPIRDQGQEESCAGFATAATREISRAIAGQPLTDYLSPAYLYARARMAEGTFPNNVGTALGDEITALINYGVCPESMLPYNQQPSESPTPLCDVGALPFRAIGASIVNHADPVFVKQVLSAKLPVLFGMPVFQSFEDVGSDGMIPVPNPAAEKLLGGHGMVLVGFLDSIQRMIVRNQYSAGWGDQGYGYLPYSMVLNFMEAWTIPPQL